MDLHHVRRGAGEPLLLIMGMSGTHSSWGEPFLGLLERDFDVVAYDHRGMGFSPKAEADYELTDLADDAVGLLDRLGWDTAHVLGISMGGMIAQDLAIRHGGRLRTLALGCTYAGGPAQSLSPPETFAKLRAGWTSGDRELALRTGWEVNVSAAVAADEERYAAFREAAIAVPARLPSIMQQLHAISRFDVHAQLGSITTPTLVIHGTEDAMLPVENGRWIAEQIPDARYEELEGVGHMFWLEQPERCAELLREHARGGVSASG
jgi:pimeloyl-ACP methyl ester carboxylesterase